ncbi:MAG: type III-A CRISPR-associated protein Cas10/Csm1, partial [Promethearchaeota archaeon]
TRINCGFKEDRINNDISEPRLEGYYSLKPLELGDKARECIFPYRTKKEAYGDYAADTTPLYKKLYKMFLNELNDVIDKSGKITFTTLYYLLFKYTLNIPSAAYKHIPDISLFDHLKTTVSIAICLYLDLIRGDPSVNIEGIGNDEILKHRYNRYLLLIGNISGIQSFLYTIASKGAGKSLKGRSFFIQYFGEILSKFLLNKLNLPVCCEIYCDGGNFYLLLPKCFESELKTLTLKIKEFLYTLFEGNLFIDLCWVDINRYNFSIDPPEGILSFKEIWEKLHQNASREKYRRYNELLLDYEKYETIFGEKESSGTGEKICKVCKREYESLKDDKCSLCNSFEKLTRNIIDAKFLVLAFSSINDISIMDDFDIIINNIEEFSSFLGFTFYICKNNRDFNDFLQKLKNLNLYEKIDILLINNNNFSEFLAQTDLRKSSLQGIRINLGFKFENQIIPLENNAIKNFDKIAADSKTLGDSKLGYLRMDIDNLGTIFSKCLGDYQSLSRLTSLSLRFSLFFKYWINEICKGNIIEDDLADIEYLKNLNSIYPNRNYLEDFKARIKNNIYLVYSGGDDLFAIGHFNDIIILADMINNIFTKYVVYNPQITISAGIYISHPKFPLYQAANLSGMQEDRAKSNEGKNSICIFEKVYYWDEFRDLCLMKEKIYYYIDEKSLSKGFIHKLFSFNAAYENVYNNAYYSLISTEQAVVQNRNIINLYYNVDGDPMKTAHEAAFYSNWHYRFVYFLKRTIDRYKDKELKEGLTQLGSQIIQSRKIKDLYLPLRWAELILRSKPNKNE